jgi:hypothetical protein
MQWRDLHTPTLSWVREPRPGKYLVSEVKRQSRVTYVSPYMIAVIYSGLGHNDNAFQFLEKAYQGRSPDIAYFIKADLRIDTLRSDPRFRDLLRRIGLPK